MPRPQAAPRPGQGSALPPRVGGGRRRAPGDKNEFKIGSEDARRVSPALEPAVLPLPTSAPSPAPCPVLLTSVQGVPADLGRRHQFQIESPEPHGHHGERQQQPEAPPQQLDRAQEQQEQRGAGTPHAAAPRRQPPAPALRPGPAPRARGVPAPAQRLRAEPRPPPPAALQQGAGSCSARQGSVSCAAAARRPQVSPGAAPPPECLPRAALLSTPLRVQARNLPPSPLAGWLARTRRPPAGSPGARQPASPLSPSRPGFLPALRPRLTHLSRPPQAPPPGHRWAPPPRRPGKGKEPLWPSWDSRGRRGGRGLVTGAPAH